MSDNPKLGQGMRIGAAGRALPAAGARPMLRRMLRRLARWPRARDGDLAPWRPLSLRWARPAPRGAGWQRLSMSTFHWYFRITPPLRVCHHGATVAPTASAPAKDGARAHVGPAAPSPAVAPATGHRRPPGCERAILAPRAPRATSAWPRHGSIGRVCAPDRKDRATATVSAAQRAPGAVAAAGARWNMHGASQAPQAAATGGHAAALAHAAPATRAPVTRQPAAVAWGRAAPEQSRKSQDAAVVPPVPAAPPPAMRTTITTAWRPAATHGRAGTGGAARQPRARLTVPLPWPAAAPPVYAVSAPHRPSEREGGATVWQAAGRAGAPVAAAGTPVPPATRRPVELVWAASAAGGAAPAGSRHRHDAVVTPAPAMPATPAAGAAHFVAGHDGATVRATALDPLLASRLADEVMRRIDQRARIERERRGA